MTNTIPQAGSKPEGPRLAGPSASFGVIGRSQLFLDIQTNPVHHLDVLDCLRPRPWITPQPSQPYPYLLCPWVPPLFHISIYLYLDNLAPSLLLGLSPQSFKDPLAKLQSFLLGIHSDYLLPQGAIDKRRQTVHCISDSIDICLLHSHSYYNVVYLFYFLRWTGADQTRS